MKITILKGNNSMIYLQTKKSIHSYHCDSATGYFRNNNPFRHLTTDINDVEDVVSQIENDYDLVDLLQCIYSYEQGRVVRDSHGTEYRASEDNGYYPDDFRRSVEAAGKLADVSVNKDGVKIKQLYGTVINGEELV